MGFSSLLVFIRMIKIGLNHAFKSEFQVETRQLGILFFFENLRLFVVDYEADEAFVLLDLVALPCECDCVVRCGVRLELQNMTFTCNDRAEPSLSDVSKPQKVIKFWSLCTFPLR